MKEDEIDINYYMSLCFKNNIKVYPILYDKSCFKIQVNYNGRKKTGDDKYNWRTQQNKMQDKIGELYETIGKKIQDRKH